LTLINVFEKSRFNVARLNLAGLRVLRIKPDLERSMLVDYNRSKMGEAERTSLYEHYTAKSKGYDVT
jgi:hypothetical protein